MMAGQPVRVAVIGLGFGAEFIPIYQRHPQAEMAAICSHPHLVHGFVSALVEQREPFPNARRSANWTCVGLCAHESALKGGELVRLPEFTLGDKGKGSGTLDGAQRDGR